MAKPTRTFSANEGDYSTGAAGPDQIEYDLDNAFAMFDPLGSLRSGASGGISGENIQSGAITDDVVGPRTADPSLVPTSNGPGTLTQWISWIANRIRAVSGMANWYDTPRVNLANVVPSGVIIMWSGTAANIPSGWALCDGTNGTPDLRDRFILGAGGSYAVGVTGGEATHTLTINELPSHSHSASTGSAGDHTHSASTGSAGGHTHSYTSVSVGTFSTGSGTGTAYNVATSSATTSSNGSHSHSVTINTAGAHTHSVSIGSTGGGAAHNNMPPYYALCFIMKL